MQTELDELMEQAKEILKNEMAEVSYNTWVRSLKLINIVDNNIYLEAVSQVQQNFIQTRYFDLVENTFNYLTNKSNQIFISCADEKKSQNSNVSGDSYGENSYFSNNSINKNYTFENFVVGDNNRFAQAAALAVAEAPGEAYNPLFLYGGVGLGKTHLMYAVGNEILKNNPNKKVLYVTSEKFTNEFINGLKDNKNEDFRNKYRGIDVLLIDDIQFIAGKKSVQEEFFHTFNAIKEQGGQIIMSSDKPPKDIDHLEDRLKSRFEWGLIADISNADYETRLAILRKKVQIDNIIIDDIILSNIATRVDSNIRELEGTLNKIIAKASLTHSPITIEMAEESINDVISKREKVISTEYIQEIISKYFNINMKDINSSKRSNDVAYPRQIAMYLCREIAGMPYKKIGEEFGKRDHSTVMHACSKIDLEIKENQNNTKLIVESVKNIILNRE